MNAYRPNRVLVQDQSWNDSTTREILARLPGIETTTIYDLDTRTPELRAEGLYAKNSLILMRYPGKFLKSCQGSGAEICCNYFVVSYAWNCHYECTYCVLQSYLSNEAIVIFLMYRTLSHRRPSANSGLEQANWPTLLRWITLHYIRAAWFPCSPLSPTVSWN